MPGTFRQDPSARGFRIESIVSCFGSYIARPLRIRIIPGLKQAWLAASLCMLCIGIALAKLRVFAKGSVPSSAGNCQIFLSGYIGLAAFCETLKRYIPPQNPSPAAFSGASRTRGRFVTTIASCIRFRVLHVQTSNYDYKYDHRRLPERTTRFGSASPRPSKPRSDGTAASYSI